MEFKSTLLKNSAEFDACDAVREPRNLLSQLPDLVKFTKELCNSLHISLDQFTKLRKKSCVNMAPKQRKKNLMDTPEMIKMSDTQAIMRRLR